MKAVLCRFVLRNFLSFLFFFFLLLLLLMLLVR